MTFNFKPEFHVVDSYYKDQLAELDDLRERRLLKRQEELNNIIISLRNENTKDQEKLENK